MFRHFSSFNCLKLFVPLQIQSISITEKMSSIVFLSSTHPPTPKIVHYKNMINLGPHINFILQKNIKLKMCSSNPIRRVLPTCRWIGQRSSPQSSLGCAWTSGKLPATQTPPITACTAASQSSPGSCLAHSCRYRINRGHIRMRSTFSRDYAAHRINTMTLSSV